MKTFLITAAFVVALAANTFGQTPTPPVGESLEAREAQIREEIRVLEARIKYLNTIRSASGSSNITAATSGGATTFATATQANLETVSLSYEALGEIAQMIDRELKPTVSRYRGLVLYHEPDFLALTRYRLYREQVRMALANYEAIVKRIEDEIAATNEVGKVRPRSVRVLGSEGFVTALSAPSIATSAIKSVAELASLFRTDQTITESRDVVDKNSLGAVVAGTFLRANPDLTIYHPEQFVAEYELGLNDPNSLYSQLSRINAAEAYLNYFLEEVKKLPAAERDSPPLSRIIAAAKVVQEQISNLGLREPGERTGNDKQETPSRISEFRQMIRAEKLERMLTQPDARVGVMKLRLLSSGGARRDKRNLLLGGKTDYSGSAVVEVVLYDADGTLRVSEVFSHHTGFRKFKTNDKPRL